jgi:hypothetical protein
MLCALLTDVMAFHVQRSECLSKAGSKCTLLKHIVRKLSVEHRLADRTEIILKVYL